ncbi:hypothetical protein HXA31_17235 [Salipaludibacillus agaradhaerens]|uniref:Uncharacterized protein n=1 Tax=Salipaludibacillus agaradhaerens TaxID=76935 RepID=A0A9Q4B526_SALAG|nr:hypothetical protein [Salipaludibacillus agaradhaerens]MCR6098285.1 hypothetical protein [Salipaludibacillus agaradhaerens]MCR6116085.1 hypothetical protein [Salipaludibacillus agaradhaerens]
MTNNYYINLCLNIIKYNRRSQLRKIINDWNFKSLTIHKINKFILIFALGVLFLSFVISSYVAIFLLPDAPAIIWLELALIIILLSSIFRAFTFYSNKQYLFYLDTTKLLHQSKDFRIMQIYSKMISSTLLFTSVVGILIFLPFSFALFLFVNTYNLLYIFASIPIFIILNLCLTLLITMVVFLFSKFFHLSIIHLFSNIIYFSILCIVSFLSAYFISSLVFDTDFVNNIMNILLQWVSQSSININNLSNSVNIHPAIGYILIIIVNSLIFILLSWLFFKILYKFDLIPYFETNNSRSHSRNYDKLSNNKSAFLGKDLLYIRRLKVWFYGHVGKTIIGVLFFIGMAIPIAGFFINPNSPFFYLSLITLVTFAIFQIIGDAFRMVLSIDGEIKNAHLFLYQYDSIWEVVKQKLPIYLMFVVVSTLVIISTSIILFNPSLLLILSASLISLIFGSLSGIFQISTTGLYPKFNWEHIYEVGYSDKGYKINSLLNNGLIMIFTLIFGAALIINNQTAINTSIVIATFTLLIALIGATVFIVTVLYLKKVKIREVFIR